MMRKIIVFEEIIPAYRWLIEIYLRMGFEVYYWRINKSIEEMGWFKRNLKPGRIKKVPFSFLLHYTDGISDTQAFENLERFFPAFLKRNPVLPDMKKLYDSDHIELAFKNILIKKLARFYYLKENMSRLRESFGKEDVILFYPVRSTDVFQILDCDVSDYQMFIKEDHLLGAEIKNNHNVHFPRWLILSRSIQCQWKRLICLAKIFMIMGYMVINLARKPLQKQFFKYGILVLSERQFETDLKPIDFLADGTQILKSEIIFIPYNRLTKNQIDHLKRKRLNYIEDSNTFFKWSVVKKGIAYFLRLIKVSLLLDIDILSNTMRLIYYYVKWESFSERLGVQHSITQNTDTVNQAIARDLIFKQKGTVSWKYMDSSSLVNYFFPLKDVTMAKENSFVYMYCDNLVSWSRDNTEIFKTTRSVVQNYWETGHFWAEYARMIQEQRIVSILKDILSCNGLSEHHKIISVFDSTFNDNTMNTYEEGIRFLEDIYRLLEEFPDVFIVLKEKKTREAVFGDSPTMANLYSKVECHPRFYSVKNFISPSEVIAFSEVVISFPFTSTSLEALSIQKKAVWYDPTHLYQGTFYDKVPGLVCHNYQELLSQVRKLLYQTTEEQYREFLKRYIENYCCSSLDGLGITRFRGLLVKYENLVNLHKLEKSLIA